MKPIVSLPIISISHIFTKDTKKNEIAPYQIHRKPGGVSSLEPGFYLPGFYPLSVIPLFLVYVEYFLECMCSIS